MRIANDTLSDLKIYAREAYSINRNIPILTMLITEEEHSELSKAYDDWLELLEEKDAQIIDMYKKEDLSHCSDEFCPNTACCFSLVYKRPPIHMLTALVGTLFKIPDFAKYKYALIVREEKLLARARELSLQIPLIISGVIFAVIGLYMMKKGVKQEQPSAQN